MSRKQICLESNIVHSSQLRRKTVKIIKAMSEVQVRAKEAMSETISRWETKCTVKQISHLKSSFHLPGRREHGHAWRCLPWKTLNSFSIPTPILGTRVQDSLKSSLHYICVCVCVIHSSVSNGNQNMLGLCHGLGGSPVYSKMPVL